MAHRAPKPQPGDPGWKHSHVIGETDPHKVKRLIDEIEADNQHEMDRIRGITPRE